jgi:hypothetical protein
MGAVQNAQTLQAGDIKLQQLRQTLDMNASEEARQAEIQAILGGLSQGGDIGETGRNLLGLDPKMGMEFMKFGQDQSNQEAELMRSQAMLSEFQNMLASSSLPDEQKAIAEQMFQYSPEKALNMLAQGDPEMAAPSYGLNAQRVQMADGSVQLIRFRDDQLNPELVQLPDGSQVATGITKIDAGTEEIIINNLTGQEIARVPKNIADAEGEKIRGRTEAERAAELPKVRAAYRELTMQRALMRQLLENAINDTGFWTSSWSGRISDAVPGTPAYDMARTIDTIRAIVGFDKLQQMRESSGSGASGLGQVTERELNFLQSVFGSFDQFQSAGQLRENLTRFYNALDGYDESRRQAFEETYGESPPQFDTSKYWNTSPISPSGVPSIGGGNIMAPATDDAGSSGQYGMSEQERMELESLRGIQ